jgi:signal transduction histidine kinase
MSDFETPRPLRALMVGQDDDEAGRIVAALRGAGLDVDPTRADSPGVMTRALKQGNFHVVVSEWAPAGFERASPLDVMRVAGHDVPVLIVSSRTSAEVITRAMRQGARDWIVRTNLDRLAPAVTREVSEARERRSGAEGQRRREDLERLSQQLEATSRLAASVAHDFNNVLAVIVGHAELLLDERPADGDEREGVLAIRAAAERASEVTRKLLAFSRRRVLVPRAIDVGPLVAGLSEHLRASCGESVELVVRCAAGLPRAWIDPLQLEQVICNLVANAREALPDGGVVTIEARAGAGPSITLEIRDDGVGMSAETQARVFQPFFSTKGPGRGLGLATAIEVVSRSGGSMQIASAVGLGTTVTMSLPPALDVDPPSLADKLETRGREAEARSEGSEPLLGSETVVLVEDEDAIRRVVRLALSRCGYRVIDFPSGEAAMAFCEVAEERLDLLLTDVVMPGMNGRELAERAVLIRPSLKVLYMSGYADGAMSAGAVADPARFLWKPFTPTEVARAVRRALDTR